MTRDNMDGRILNKHLNKIIFPAAGEEICKNCCGSGIKPFPGSLVYTKVVLRCSICNGNGKVDWIEKVVGVKQEK
jgi:DnaJ-class molecular chaperone